MGLLSGIQNTFRKSEAAVIVQNLLQIQATAGLLRANPAKLANKLVGDVWDTKPDVFSGKFDQRPYKLTTAICALAHGYEIGGFDELTQGVIIISLGNALGEIDVNGRLYPLNSLDRALLEQAMGLYLRAGQALQASGARAHPLPDVPALPKRSELKASDIDDAFRIYENGLSHKPYVTTEQVVWASAILDDDIRNEVAKSASELEAMWVDFERRFGHRGPAKVGRETELRDPVVKRTVVRTFRAKDEQCRRLGFPPSRKPEAWLTYYRGGNVGLEPAPWQTRDATTS